MLPGSAGEGSPPAAPPAPHLEPFGLAVEANPPRRLPGHGLSARGLLDWLPRTTWALFVQCRAGWSRTDSVRLGHVRKGRPTPGVWTAALLAAASVFVWQNISGPLQIWPGGCYSPLILSPRQDLPIQGGNTNVSLPLQTGVQDRRGVLGGVCALKQPASWTHSFLDSQSQGADGPSVPVLGKGLY